MQLSRPCVFIVLKYIKSSAINVYIRSITSACISPHIWHKNHNSISTHIWYKTTILLQGKQRYDISTLNCVARKALKSQGYSKWLNFVFCHLVYLLLTLSLCLVCNFCMHDGISFTHIKTYIFNKHIREKAELVSLHEINIILCNKQSMVCCVGPILLYFLKTYCTTIKKWSGHSDSASIIHL
jgi:hypothetical protein